MKLTDKQREALQALADVMQEHDITCEGGNVDGNIELLIGNDIVGGYDEELYDLNPNTITKLLQEKE
ncbi:MAG: hypothetical protein OQK29_01275 [Ignavibacteriaceae bacterium]|nr:hypothetical protein [Ignavibacteriaceae bacterium]